MKSSLFVLLVTIALSSALANGDISVAVTLRDSSVIKGTVADTTVLEGAVAFTDGVKLPAALIRELAADDTSGVQIATLVNGDKFRFTPTTKALSVATVLGDLTIPLTNMLKLSFSTSGTASDGLIYYCTFDSPEAIQKPAVGPAGKFLSGRFVEGKVGEALAVRAYTSGAYVQLPPNTIGQKGCFEFWAKFTPPAERIGVGQWPCFFTCGVLGAAPRFCLEWNANNGTGGGGVNAMLEHIRACTSGYGGALSYYEILGNGMTEWHHYALVWNKDGISSLSSGASLPVKAAIYLDGKPIAREAFRNVPNWKLSSSLTDPTTFLSFPTHPEDGVQNHVDYVIDEFKFWNYDQTDFGL